MASAFEFLSTGLGPALTGLSESLSSREPTRWLAFVEAEKIRQQREKERLAVSQTDLDRKLAMAQLALLGAQTQEHLTKAKDSGAHDIKAEYKATFGREGTDQELQDFYRQTYGHYQPEPKRTPFEDMSEKAQFLKMLFPNISDNNLMKALGAYIAPQKPNAGSQRELDQRRQREEAAPSIASILGIDTDDPQIKSYVATGIKSWNLPGVRKPLPPALAAEYTHITSFRKYIYRALQEIGIYSGLPKDQVATADPDTLYQMVKERVPQGTVAQMYQYYLKQTPARSLYPHVKFPESNIYALVGMINARATGPLARGSSRAQAIIKPMQEHLPDRKRSFAMNVDELKMLDDLLGTTASTYEDMFLIPETVKQNLKNRINATQKELDAQFGPITAEPGQQKQPNLSVRPHQSY